MSLKPHQDLYIFFEYIDKSLSAPFAPALPDELAKIPEFEEFHQRILSLRSILGSFARGELSVPIELRGFIGGSLKALQAHLKHLTWQVQQVEHGDFSQRVEFLGDFSVAFNNMVVQLDNTVKALRKKEEDLTNLAQTLQSEVELRTSAVYALRRSEAKFKYLAEHDSLTGAFNRSTFLSVVLLEMEKANLNKEISCIGMLDVDKFKKLNDTYGHLAGDEALKFLVVQSAKSLRQTDLMGRFGGEEFIFYFSATNIDQGFIAAERIRKSISEKVFKFQGKDIPITVSIGVSCILPEWIGMDKDFLLQQVIAQADAALYKAKESGRNCVKTAEVIKPSLERFSQ